jgi:PPOX class probable FMN-dependent enzyme
MTSAFDDLSADALSSVAELRDVYASPGGNANRKLTDRIDAVTREFIACAPILFIASTDADGRADVTPRGGTPGFVTVLDDHTLVIPDATGNKRLDSLQNIVATRQAGMIFVIPGRGQTLRINGRACVTTRPELLEKLTPVGKPPLSAIVVRADEVYTHCPKAFVRSKLWDPASWPPADAQPSPARLLQSHVGDPELTIEQIEKDQADSLKYRLA